MTPHIIPLPHIARDHRGAFGRLPQPPFDVAEENLSISLKKGTVRGLHWQEPQQAKLVRVLSGAILDACVRLADGQVFLFEMSDASGDSLLCPQGYAHGFCTLEDNTQVSYKVSTAYAAGAQFGINPFDPALDIPWPVSEATAVISDKDRNADVWRKINAA